MTFANFQLAVAYGGAFSMLAVGLVQIVRFCWQQHRTATKAGMLVFAIGVTVSTLQAQKPPRPPVVSSMHLRLDRFDAKGFDVSWDYGGMAPSDFRDGENVKLSVEIEGLDYVMHLATVPVTVTNYHVNAIAHGLPRDWMRHNVKVTAACNNLLGTATNDGDVEDLPPSIYDGGNE